MSLNPEQLIEDIVERANRHESEPYIVQRKGDAYVVMSRCNNVTSRIDITGEGRIWKAYACVKRTIRRSKAEAMMRSFTGRLDYVILAALGALRGVDVTGRMTGTRFAILVQHIDDDNLLTARYVSMSSTECDDWESAVEAVYKAAIFPDRVAVPLLRMIHAMYPQSTVAVKRDNDVWFLEVSPGRGHEPVTISVLAEGDIVSRFADRTHYPVSWYNLHKVAYDLVNR